MRAAGLLLLLVGAATALTDGTEAVRFELQTSHNVCTSRGTIVVESNIAKASEVWMDAYEAQAVVYVDKLTYQLYILRALNGNNIVFENRDSAELYRQFNPDATELWFLEGGHVDGCEILMFV